MKVAKTFMKRYAHCPMPKQYRDSSSTNNFKDNILDKFWQLCKIHIGKLL